MEGMMRNWLRGLRCNASLGDAPEHHHSLVLLPCAVAHFDPHHFLPSAGLPTSLLRIPHSCPAAATPCRRWLSPLAIACSLDASPVTHRHCGFSALPQAPSGSAAPVARAIEAILIRPLAISG